MRTVGNRLVQNGIWEAETNDEISAEANRPLSRQTPLIKAGLFKVC